MCSVTQHGYLVIASISGSTSFVAKTELDHSHEILSDLPGLAVNLIRRRTENHITEETGWCADLNFSVDLPLPIAWEWFQNPEKRNLVMPAVDWSMGDRPLGRSAIGASNHRAHGSEVSTETNRFEEFPSVCTRIHALVQLAPHHSDRTLMDTVKLAGEQYPAVAELE